ncbi:flagellar hook-associated protein FlgL [Comamonas sp.]
MSIQRMGTAHMYDRTITNINKQQSELALQMEHATAGKRVIRASDDPVAAAQAERARNRMSRIESDQRVLDAQVSTISYAEATLGEINSALQQFRELTVQAGNASYDDTQRDAIAQQLISLRDQIASYTNRKDSNGLPLFRGLDTKSETPFPAQQSGIHAGQVNAGEYSITNSLNGAFAFFDVTPGNGVFRMAVPPAAFLDNSDKHAANKGKVWADVGAITNLADVEDAPQDWVIVFQKSATDPEVMEYVAYDRTDYEAYLADNTVALPTDTPRGTYQANKSVEIYGMTLTLKGTPEEGDTILVDRVQDSEKPKLSMFEVMDQAITAITTKSKDQPGALEHGVALSLANLDTAMSRVSTVRATAGDLLNQADRKSESLTTQSDLQEVQRSNAEDIDMVKALSDMKAQETAVSVALQSYASIQKLSLFNYIG